MSFLKIIFVILEVLLLFNLLIFVHELGHFLAARWRGLKIDRFAIWFGKPIWKAKINGGEYALGSIPAGGYVALRATATREGLDVKGARSLRWATSRCRKWRQWRPSKAREIAPGQRCRRFPRWIKLSWRLLGRFL